MGISRIVSIKDIYKDNPRLCLSPLRYTRRCYNCPKYDKCESRIVNKEYEQKIAQKHKLEAQIKELQEEINKLGIN